MYLSRKIALATVGAMLVTPLAAWAASIPKTTPIYPNRIPKSYSGDGYDGGYAYSLETNDSPEMVDAWYKAHTTGFTGEHVKSEIADSYHYEKHADGGEYSLQIQKQTGEPTGVTFSFTKGA
ncbi:MAG: hypothetical protein M3N13_11020 [Candidatus Eremiobacteraeota bacterium]|nr:hypothetical protein [Candidatus Eremiobacteraeota bacterium]